MAVWHYIYLACTQHKTIETTCRVVLVAQTALGTSGQKRACLAALLYHKRICLGPDCASSCHTQLATHKWSVHNKKYCKWKSAGRQWRIPAAVAAQLEASTSTPSPGSSPSPSPVPVPVPVAAAGHVVACRQLHPVLSWHTKEKQQRTHKTCSSSRSSMWHTPQRRPWSQGPSNKYREFFTCVSVCVVCVCDFPIESVLLFALRWVSPHCTPRWTATMWSTMARSTMTPRVCPTWIGPSWLRCVLWG